MHHHWLYKLTVDLVGSTLLYKVYMFRLCYLVSPKCFFLKGKCGGINTLYHMHEEEKKKRKTDLLQYIQMSI